jgi:alpha-N-arabinofuranosidase
MASLIVARCAALAASAALASAAALTVDATNVLATISPLVHGCHSDLGYAHAGRGFYSQMVFGEIFERTPIKVSAWSDVLTGTAQGGAFLDDALTFNGNPTLAIVFNGTGSGTVGRANRGLGNAGVTWIGNKGYSGYIYMSAPAGTSVTIALVDTVTQSVQDTSTVISPPGGAFNRFDFTLGPGANTTCVAIPAGSDPTIDCGALPNADFACLKCSGEIQVILTAPGVAHIGYVFVSPGSWGTLEGLPVRLDTVQRLQQMGITAIRQGGTYAQTIYWKQWRGPAAFRPSNGHLWGNSLISGWGPFDFIDMCQAAGFVPIVTLAEDQPGDDWADLVDYIWGGVNTTWGAQRAADGHPDPYVVSIFELGNEQYNNQFIDQVTAMEKRAAALGRAGELTYMFPSNGGLSASDLARAAAAGLPLSRIGADIHVSAGGAVAAAEGVFAKASAYPTIVAGNFETNADYPAHPGGMHGQTRALLEATDLNTWYSTPAAVASRLVARAASFCNSAASNFDGFDQAVSFFGGGATWLQPPGWVHAMNAATRADQALAVSGDAGGLSVSAQRTAAADHLYVRLVNSAAAPVDVTLTLANWAASPAATSWTLAAAVPNGGNSFANQTAVAPVQAAVTIRSGDVVTVPALAYVVLGFVPA